MRVAGRSLASARYGNCTAYQNRIANNGNVASRTARPSIALARIVLQDRPGVQGESGDQSDMDFTLGADASRFGQGMPTAKTLAPTEKWWMQRPATNALRN